MKARILNNKKIVYDYARQEKVNTVVKPTKYYMWTIMLI